MTTEQSVINRLESLEAELKSLKYGKIKPVIEKKPRKPSAYNEFMAKEIEKIKKEKADKNEKYNHKESFSLVAKLWQEQKSK